MNRIEWLDTLPKGSVGAEIGVAAASYSLQMLQRVKPARLYLVDRWALIGNPGAKGKKELQMHTAISKIAPYVAQGVALPICAWSSEAAEWVPNGSLDWVYIDGDHKPDAVHDDMKKWYQKVKAGGVVAGHDYARGLGPYEGANRAIKKLQPDAKINVVDGKCRTPSFWFVKEEK